jgi:hypothetical protein
MSGMQCSPAQAQCHSMLLRLHLIPVSPCRGGVALCEVAVQALGCSCAVLDFALDDDWQHVCGGAVVQHLMQAPSAWRIAIGRHIQSRACGLVVVVVVDHVQNHHVG